MNQYRLYMYSYSILWVCTLYSTIVHIDRAWAVIYEYKYPSITLWTVPLTRMHQHRLYCILWVCIEPGRWFMNINIKPYTDHPAAPRPTEVWYAGRAANILENILNSGQDIFQYGVLLLPQLLGLQLHFCVYSTVEGYGLIYSIYCNLCYSLRII